MVRRNKGHGGHVRKKAATELAGISSWASTQEKKELTRMHKKEWRRSSISVLKLEKKLGKVVNMERERESANHF